METNGNAPQHHLRFEYSLTFDTFDLQKQSQGLQGASYPLLLVMLDSLVQGFMVHIEHPAMYGAPIKLKGGGGGPDFRIADYAIVNEYGMTTVELLFSSIDPSLARSEAWWKCDRITFTGDKFVVENLHSRFVEFCKGANLAHIRMILESVPVPDQGGGI